MSYNPSDVGKKGSLFGYPYSEREADLIIIPVPWDVTVSYGAGTSNGPRTILEASPQLDLSLPGIRNPWEFGVFMQPVSMEIKNLSDDLRRQAKSLIDQLEKGHTVNRSDYTNIEKGCLKTMDWVYRQATTQLEKGKFCATLGGDHSTPYGLIKALAKRMDFGILQIDAHMDLRRSYEGFTHSHASIMYNVLNLNRIKKLVQIGIRDYSPEEEKVVNTNNEIIKVFYDQDLKNGLLEGKTWKSMTDEIIEELPDKVYISFDIDGLDPSLCPGTGTPVPGGLQFHEISYLLEQLSRSGKKIVGFDLSEVSPGTDTWNGNVGARILYRLCTGLAISQGKLN